MQQMNYNKLWKNLFFTFFVSVHWFDDIIINDTKNKNYGGVL